MPRKIFGNKREILNILVVLQWTLPDKWILRKFGSSLPIEKWKIILPM